jgi:hypothetical protein
MAHTALHTVAIPDGLRFVCRQDLKHSSSWRAAYPMRWTRNRKNFSNSASQWGRKSSTPFRPSIPGWMPASSHPTRRQPQSFFSTQRRKTSSRPSAHAYAAIVSEPKQFKLYDAPHALNAEARRDSQSSSTAQPGHAAGCCDEQPRRTTEYSLPDHGQSGG